MSKSIDQVFDRFIGVTGEPHPAGYGYYTLTDWVTAYELGGRASHLLRNGQWWYGQSCEDTWHLVDPA
jgi:hypothetical protein